MLDEYQGGARQVRFRYDVVRNGAKYDELLAAEAPAIEMVYNAEIKLSLSGVFLHNPRVDYLDDFIRPMMGIGSAWYPLGEYAVGTAEDRSDGSRLCVSIEAYDRALYLKQATTTRRILFARGNRYLDVIQAILLENGIQRIVIPEKTADVLQTDREDWEIGTPYLTIVNKLLSEINYNSLWFDFDGNAQLTRYVPPNRAEIQHQYAAGEFSVLRAPYSRVHDLYNAYNVFVRVVNSPDFPAPLVARAVNDDPDSPISTVRRGREIVDPEIQMDNIASQQALQEYVNNLMERSKLSTQTVAYETANLPTHRIRDIVSLSNRDLSAVVSETRWTMTLSHEGSMTHEGRVIVYD